jgi:hypothetical protein
MKTPRLANAIVYTPSSPNLFQLILNKQNGHCEAHSPHVVKKFLPRHINGVPRLNGALIKEKIILLFVSEGRQCYF